MIWKVRKLTNCRMCQGKNLKVFLDLGNTALANSFLKKGDLKKQEDKFPLIVCFCQNCGLSQLTHVVNPEILFRDYVYFSSGMPVLPQHFKDYADEVVKRFVTTNKDLVVELGSNDGILLKAIKEQGARILGVDPAVNIAKVANARGIETIPEFFSLEVAKKIKKKYGNTKVIIGNNVVAHIDNHLDLVRAVKYLLSDDGVFIFEAPYLVDMFENLTFDTIYHEHLSYLSLKPLSKMFEKFGMEIFDAKIFPVQGNSLRTYVGKKGMYKISPNVRRLIQKEQKMKLNQFSTYLKLASEVNQTKTKVMQILENLKKKGKTIAGYGAPAKGNTLLHFYGIGSDILDYATEGLPSKIGLYTPGTHIPVIDIVTSRKNPPDYYLMLAWNYKNAILEKEKDYIKKGGKFIVPVGRKVEII